MRLCHSLGALDGRAWRQARCEPRQLRPRAYCLSARPPLRRSEYMAIPRRVAAVGRTRTQCRLTTRSTGTADTSFYLAIGCGGGPVNLVLLNRMERCE